MVEEGGVDYKMYLESLCPYSKLLSVSNHPKCMRKDDLSGEIVYIILPFIQIK